MRSSNTGRRRPVATAVIGVLVVATRRLAREARAHPALMATLVILWTVALVLVIAQVR
ncbi:MAG: hypothetical protein OXE43_04630 [Chloroflexi bacterium]|nr:hypothetical protein [Chloroflexota bacterium]